MATRLMSKNKVRTRSQYADDSGDPRPPGYVDPPSYADDSGDPRPEPPRDRPVPVNGPTQPHDPTRGTRIDPGQYTPQQLAEMARGGEQFYIPKGEGEYANQAGALERRYKDLLRYGPESTLNLGAEQTLNRRMQEMQGFSPQEQKMMREGATRGIKAQTAQQARQMQAAQGMAGVRGATASSQLGGIRAFGAEQERQAGKDIDLANIQARRQGLTDAERSVFGRQLAISAGETSEEQMKIQRESLERGLEIQASVPSSSGGTFACAALFVQGMIPDDVFAADIQMLDRSYGEMMLIYAPLIMAGYMVIGKPLAKGMLRSKILTRMAKPFVFAWQRDMAYRMGYSNKRSIFGSLVNTFGEKLCYIIGRVKYGLKV